MTFFDRSNGFGSSDDRLGRLAEINKTQLENALRDMKSNFARTDAGFNRQLVNTKNKTRLDPIVSGLESRRHYSP